MIRVRVTAPNLAARQRYLQRVQQRLNDRGPALVKAANAIASVWEDNFRSEGSKVGGWPALAAKTVENRVDQGYSPGPILVRYGALKSVVTEGFMTANGTSSWSKGDPYSNTNTTARLTISKEMARLEAHGWKIGNQYGRRSGNGRVPARPFWFVDRQIVVAARKATEEWIKDEVIKA